MAAEELVGCVLAISIYQFLEKIGQEKKGYLSVCVDKSLRREQNGGSIVYSQH